MRLRPFKQVDVFTALPFAGNPVAVVLDAEGLDTARMQAIARWTNLSETTFVLPPSRPEADYRLRIFTPGDELPFAGHPTLGSGHALLELAAAPQPGRAGGAEGPAPWYRALAGRNRLRQECGAGLIDLALDASAGRIWLGMPEARMQPLESADVRRMAEALGLAAGGVRSEATRVDVGPVWVIAELASAEAVLALSPDTAGLAALSEALGATGITVFGAHRAGDAAYEVRSFAPAHGIPEDPVCGSGNGSVAHWLLAHGRAADYQAAQGRALGRDGRIGVRFAHGRPQIGGQCVTCVDGTLLA